MNSGKRVAFETLGCKLNQAESEGLVRDLAEAGCEVVAPEDKADIYILNTCTVTHIADRKARHLLRLARRRNPEAVIVALGCYAERAPTELGRIEEVDLVLNYKGKEHLVAFLEEAGFMLRDKKQKSLPPNLRTRAFIKIQQGCATPCTYCIVPMVRGKESSQPPDEVIAQIQARRAEGFSPSSVEGYQEVVLTGTKVGSYSFNGVNLTGLMKRILAETDVPRIRLSSLQPQEISPELLALWQDERLCRHFHLALQSGSETVLQRMKRRYSLREYQEAVELIRSMVPDVAITTDIIVGFPGETDAEFQESLDFCRKMAFARIHVFPYSPRRETPAARMPDPSRSLRAGQTNEKVKKERTAQMLSFAEESAHSFQRRFLDRTLPVLWEKQSDGIWSGLTGNYIKVYCKIDEDLTNKITEIRLVQVEGDGVWSTICI